MKRNIIFENESNNTDVGPACSVLYENAVRREVLERTCAWLIRQAEKYRDVASPKYSAVTAHVFNDFADNLIKCSLPIRAVDAQNEIAIFWHIDDVLSVRPLLSHDQARQVLAAIDHGHDAEYGISWDTLRYAADDLFPDVKLGGHEAFSIEITPHVLQFNDLLRVVKSYASDVAFEQADRILETLELQVGVGAQQVSLAIDDWQIVTDCLRLARDPDAVRYVESKLVQVSKEEV